LDEEAASEERVPEEGVAEARKAERLSKFAGLTGKYEKLTVLRPRPMTLAVLRLDGAPNQRGAEIDRVAAKLGAAIEHPVPHDHRSMGVIEGYHSVRRSQGRYGFASRRWGTHLYVVLLHGERAQH
jgi:hypothetical protein